MNEQKKLTWRDFRKIYESGEKITAISVYDTVMARLADESGIQMVLVGDSMGMTVLGYENTLAVTLDQSLHHTAAVVRGVRRALVIGDMPFLSFHINPDETVRNAGRYLQEAGADGVKLEGGRELVPVINRLVTCGIPVLGHIGLLPQRVIADGGYRIHGKSEHEANGIIDDAKALEDAGVSAIILEGIPTTLGKRITDMITIPTIGIGAGAQCSGQIQVAHDILGLLDGFTPKHSKRYAELATDIRTVFEHYRNDVLNQDFPEAAQSS